jgi:hypothetical protein
MLQPTVEVATQSSPSPIHDDEDVTKASQARPRSLSQSSAKPTPQDEDVVDSEPVSAAFSSPEKPSASSHKSKYSLSALAKPFVFESSPVLDSPPQPREEESVALPKVRKVTGLNASRWATTPSPPRSPPAVLSDTPSLSWYHQPAIKTEPESDKDVKISGSLEDHVEDPILDGAETPQSNASIAAVERDFARDQTLHHLQEPSSPLAGDSVPSFEEIDEVMKHLDRNPELGIEREASPMLSTPLIDMRIGSNFRSDAPSPSPRRRSGQQQSRPDAASTTAYGLGIGIHKLNTGKEEVSDWNDTLSPTDEDKLQSRAQFFDGHVNDLVDGILENRLGPLERTLQTIQHSIALMATRPQKKDRPSLSTDLKDSDADDEDDYDAYEGFSSYRSQSPEARKDKRRTSKIRAAVAEGMAVYRENQIQQPQVDLSEVLSELATVKRQLEEKRQVPQQEQQDIRAALDEVISNHPRLRGSRVQQDHESESKYKIHVDGLNALLKAEQERANHETKLRKKADEEIELLKHALRTAEAGSIQTSRKRSGSRQSQE